MSRANLWAGLVGLWWLGVQGRRHGGSVRGGLKRRRCTGLSGSMEYPIPWITTVEVSLAVASRILTTFRHSLVQTHLDDGDTSKAL